MIKQATKEEVGGSTRLRGAVLLTGASSGIGRATLNQLSQAGVPVLAAVRREEDVQSIHDLCLPEVIPLLMELRDPARIRQVVSDLEAQGRPLRALVNNAGIALPGPIEMIERDEVLEQLETNLVAPLDLIRAVLPLLRKHGEGARILQVSSVSAWISPSLAGAYAASKHAMEAVTDALREELRPWGIPVVSVVPGRVDTPIWDKVRQRGHEILGRVTRPEWAPYREAMEARLSGLPASRGIPPDRVASRIVTAVLARRPKPRYLVGADAYLCLGISRLPLALRDTILRKLAG